MCRSNFNYNDISNTVKKMKKKYTREETTPPNL